MRTHDVSWRDASQQLDIDARIFERARARGLHFAPAMRNREHGGFSNYAGGGYRDRDPRAASSFEVGQGWRPADRGGTRMTGARMGGTDMGFGEPDRERYTLQNRGPHYGKGPKGYKRSDERIHEEVCEVIARQGWVDASDVEVVVEAGVVRLVGTVLSRQDKRELEGMIEHVHGVHDVCNELRLANANARANVQPSKNGKSVAS